MSKVAEKSNEVNLNREQQLILEMAGILAAQLPPNSTEAKPENAVKKAKELLEQTDCNSIAEVVTVGKVAAMFFAARSSGSSNSTDVKNAVTWAVELLHAVSGDHALRSDAENRSRTV